MTRPRRVTGPCWSSVHDRAPLTCEDCVYELLVDVREDIRTSTGQRDPDLDAAIARIEADRAADAAFVREADA